MKITDNKKDIILGVLNTEDEWILKAIRKLLDIEDIPEAHKLILEERQEEYYSNPNKLIDWDDLQKEIMG
ncbi:MAG: addiction module protein [Sphingobacteriales bacterium]|nr:addiction module protein [Sphingobacteriales bacterium]MBI3720254.1 addiction module protein [Sphingobacteriales bacterium]